MRSDSETRLVKAVLDYLAYMKIPAWRNNSGCVAGEYQGRKRFVRFGIVGGSDILGCIPGSGRLLAVECKSRTGRQTAAQRDWQRAITEAGGLYVLARNLDDVADALK